MKGLSWDHPRLWGGRPGLGPVGRVSWAEPLLFSVWNRGEVPPRGAQVPGHPVWRHPCPLLVGAAGVLPTVPRLPVCRSKQCLDPKQIGFN